MMDGVFIAEAGNATTKATTCMDAQRTERASFGFILDGLRTSVFYKPAISAIIRK